MLKNNNEIMVSICCITYNHENYIEDAIKGFLMQKTDFKFEILIHDDASIDNTAKIIKKYEKKYPHLIKVIYQKENQFSKGVRILNSLFEKSKGKYIAICEGDDYWIDEYKLQKQINYMEDNQDCTFCFTNAIKQNLITNQKQIFIEKNWLNKKVFKLQDFNLGELAEFDFIPTASFVFPKRNLNNMPDFYDIPFVAGDFKLKLACTYQGYAHFINESMVVYRAGVPDSITISWSRESDEKIIERWQNFVNVIDKIDKETKQIYHKNLDRLSIHFERWILYLKRDKRILNERYMEYYKDSSLKEKISLNLYLRCYGIYNFFKKIKDLTKNG